MPQLTPPDATGATPDLKRCILTNLYNARPTWLANARATLDRPVWAAYEWDSGRAHKTNEEILPQLLRQNGELAKVFRRKQADVIDPNPSYGIVCDTIQWSRG